MNAIFDVLDSTRRVEWNNIVKSFKNWDVYYLFEYSNSFSIHGDGEPLLILYTSGNSRLCFTVMKKDIADDKKFKDYLDKKKYYDLETPYGYGGPLTDNELSVDEQKDFIDEFSKFCLSNNIVSILFRFHPLLNNYCVLDKYAEYRYMHDTIYIDTKDEETINSNLDPKNRNMIRKAIKNDVQIVNKPITDYQDFISIYNQTMGNLNADNYYYFADSYFKSLYEMKDNAYISYAYKDNKVIAGSIIFFNDKYMHYHLSGTDREYRNLPATNLILYESAKLAVQKGIKTFHLGGGLSQDDSLFGFKKQFNRKDRLQFYVGRYIFDKDKYDYLLSVRKESDIEFDINNNRMIQYRY